MLYKDLDVKQRSYRKTDVNDNKVVVFAAKKIITIGEKVKEAEAVAVENGEIIAVGSLNQVKGALENRGIVYELNDEFKDKVILPGFIEAHMHPQWIGAFLDYPYVGYTDIHDYNGDIIKGYTSLEDVVSYLKDIFEKGKGEFNDKHWINAWGVDPVTLGLEPSEIDRKVLDKVSSEVPIAILHQSTHSVSLNSRGIELCKFEEVDNPYVGRYEDGTCSGFLSETPNIFRVMTSGGFQGGKNAIEASYNGTLNATKIAKATGCTTIADKGFGVIALPDPIGGYRECISKNSLKTRIVVEPHMLAFNGADKWDKISNLRRELECDKLMFGNIKLVLDGAYQGYTAYLLDKNYYNGDENSEPLFNKEFIKEFFKDCEEHGYSVSMHTNGDGATELALSAIEELHSDEPKYLFRHSFEHNQLVSENQLYRMKKQNISCNFFANHMYYWADVHTRSTVGPALVKRMNPCRSAKNHGVRFSLHSDCPITEVNPLLSAWCACNRKSIQGVVNGSDQCLTVEEALRAITIDAAWLLGQEDNIGSIEVGKWADFVILEEEPTEEKIETLKDIKVITTILGGKVQ